MKVEIKDGKVILDACEMFDNMDADELHKLVQSLACQDAILKHVTDQLLEGWTEDGYHGSKGGDATGNSPLDLARRRIALGAGKVAKETIEAQQRQIENEKELGKKGWAAYHKLFDERH